MGGTVDASGAHLVVRGRRLLLSYAPGAKGNSAQLRIYAWAGSDPSANPIAHDARASEGAAYRAAQRPSAIATSALRPITIRRETSNDRLGKRLRINREIQLGDPAFDDELYLETTLAEPLVVAILHREVRALVLNLLASPIELTLYAGPYLVTALWHPIFEESLSRESLSATVDAIAQLASMLPHDAPTQTVTQYGALLPVVLPTISAQLAAAIGLSLTTRAKHVSSAPYGWGFVTGLAVWVALTVLVALLVRGRSNSLRTFVACSLFLLPAALVVGIAGVPALNARLDESPAIARELEITDTRLVRGKNSVTYYAVAPAWNDPSETLEVRLDPVDRERWGRGARVRVLTHSGRFGWAWYDDVTLVRAACRDSSPCPDALR